MKQEVLFSKIPATHILLARLEEVFPAVKSDVLKRLIQRLAVQVRQHPQNFHLEKRSKDEVEEHLFELLRRQVEHLQKGTLHKVINATGVVLHTGLGRAPIDPHLTENLLEVSRYCNLEFDLESGKRGQRNDHLSYLLQILFGAEDGFAVNNNAAAVMLMLNTLGAGKEVILSRGEMIEIGGSFRLPEVMKVSGCILHEIGTTNKTHLRDYEQAINENTGAILICHSSNYLVQGFTHKPPLDEIIELAHTRGIPVIYDLGSGSTDETAHLFGEEEPEVVSILKAGVDLVSFSGDKLLGGPQAGIIVGKKEYVQRCAKNHLLRALRLDKFMIKHIQLVLTRYLYKDVSQQLSAHRALMAEKTELQERCERFYRSLPEELQQYMQIVQAFGKVGSGAYPLLKLPSVALRLEIPGISPQKLSKALRKASVPVIGYIEDDAYYLDLRTVAEDEETLLLQTLSQVVRQFIQHN